MEERSDFIEIEAKVVPHPPYARLVELAQDAAPPGFRMVRKPHVAFFDLYLDTARLGLANNHSYLRARFDLRGMRGKGKFKLFYKDNGPPPDGQRYVSRREVRTDLKRAEFLPFATQLLVGNAAQLAYSVLERVGEGAEPLQAVCVISTFRRYYTMHSDDPEKSDCLNLGIEHSTAFRARDVDLDMLLASCFLDAQRGCPVYDFDLAEAELTVENSPEADRMFQQLAAALDREYGLVVGSKYLDCLEKLAIRPEAPA
jgi:hypothetical protein